MTGHLFLLVDDDKSDLLAFTQLSLGAHAEGVIRLAEASIFSAIIPFGGLLKRARTFQVCGVRNDRGKETVDVRGGDCCRD